MDDSLPTTDTPERDIRARLVKVRAAELAFNESPPRDRQAKGRTVVGIPFDPEYTSANAAEQSNIEADDPSERTLAWVASILLQMPPELRCVVLLHMDGLSQKEIAATLGVSVATVSRKLKAATVHSKTHLRHLFTPPEVPHKMM